MGVAVTPQQALAGLLARETGQQLLANRHWRVEMALNPIMRRHSIPDIAILASILESGGEAALLKECVEAMINNETCFFRDQANFNMLQGPLLDSFRAKRSASRQIRIWSAACSTGQEPYSLAMALLENAEKWHGWAIEIMATDISGSALHQAREGRYSQFEIQRGLPVGHMLKFFRQEGNEWVARDSLRKMVKFAPHNLLDPSHRLGRFDLILCRNVLMYFCDDRRKQVLDGLAGALMPDGLLMLGAAETVIGQTDRLAVAPDFRGFYAVNALPTSEQRIAS